MDITRTAKGKVKVSLSFAKLLCSQKLASIGQIAAGALRVQPVVNKVDTLSSRVKDWDMTPQEHRPSENRLIRGEYYF